MKKILLFFTMLLFTAALKAQINFASAAEIKTFLNSKTCVVIDQDPFSSFNETLKACMSKFWTITPYEFISMDEFDVRKSKSTYSFLLLSDAEQEEEGVTCTYNFLNFILGGNTDLNKMPDLGSVPLSYVDVPEDGYLYKLGGMLLFMQDHVKYASEHPSWKPVLVNKESGTDITTKELWLVKEELPDNFNTPDKIKTVYPFTVKLVTKEQIKAAIEEKNAKVVFLHKVGPEGTVAGGKCWKFLVAASDGEVLYYDGHKVDATHPDAFLEKDFKSIAK